MIARMPVHIIEPSIDLKNIANKYMMCMMCMVRKYTRGWQTMKMQKAHQQLKL